MRLPLKVDPFFAAGNRIGIQDADGRFIGEGAPGSSFRTFSMEEATEIVSCVNSFTPTKLLSIERLAEIESLKIELENLRIQLDGYRQIEKERNRLIRWQQLAIEARPGIELEIDLPPAL